MVKKYEIMTVGQIVRDNFETAELFNRAGIDFCCGGKQLLKDACQQYGLEFEKVAAQIEEINKEHSDTVTNFKDWSPDFLADYIVNSHHAYVQKTLPQLIFYTQKIAEVHGENHTELQQIAVLTKELNKDMLQHLAKEEDIVFPAIRKAFGSNKKEDLKIAQQKIGELANEHDTVGELLKEINDLSNNYRTPADACETYAACFGLFRQFEKDTHIHIHLENNVLFPAITKN